MYDLITKDTIYLNYKTWQNCADFDLEPFMVLEGAMYSTEEKSNDQTYPCANTISVHVGASQIPAQRGYLITNPKHYISNF